MAGHELRCQKDQCPNILSLRGENDAYDSSCWLGCVLNVNEQKHAITVTFLHPSIPSASFFYPKRKDVLDTDLSDILTRVQPSIATVTGRTYTLSKKEVEDVTAALEVYLCE